jgi:hypothetical protein
LNQKTSPGVEFCMVAKNFVSGGGFEVGTISPFQDVRVAPARAT